MGKTRRRLLAMVGVAVGIIAVRRFRKRRSITAESEAVYKGHKAADSATEHAIAATEHARHATKKAIKMGKAEN